jgi:hypothetical protein
MNFERNRLVKGDQLYCVHVDINDEVILSETTDGARFCFSAKYAIPSRIATRIFLVTGRISCPSTGHYECPEDLRRLTERWQD